MVTTLDNWEEKRETTDEGDVTLDSYNDLDPPKVTPGAKIKTPRQKGRAGQTGYDPRRDQKVYVSPRSPGLHFFYRFNGWGVSEQVLDEIRDQDVKRVYIQERGESKRGYDMVYEFTIDQYVNGEKHWDNGPDPQRVVDIDDAVALWPEHSKSLWAGWDASEL